MSVFLVLRDCRPGSYSLISSRKVSPQILKKVLNQLSLQQRRIGNKSRIGLAVKAQGDHKISPVGNNISSLLSRKGQEPFYFITKIPRRTFTKVESLDKEQ